MKWFTGVSYYEMHASVIAVPEICITKSNQEAASVYSSKLTHGDGVLIEQEQVHWRTRDRYADTLYPAWVVQSQLRYVSFSLGLNLTFVSLLSLV